MARPRRPELHPRLADFRRRAGFTQELVSDRIGATVEMVRRHERGISMPSEIYRDRYSLLYGATQAELGFGTGQGSMADPVTPNTADSSRATDNPPALLTAPMWAPEYADKDYLARVHSDIKQIIALDNRFGGTDLYKLAERSFRTVHNLLGTGSYAPGIEKDLLAAAGELAEVAGWLAYDADRQDAVRQMNQESLYFTRLAGDKKMELLTLQNASMHASFLNRSREALHIVDSVLNGNYHLSSRLRALFLTRKIRALAQGGDDSSLQMFKEVQSLYLDGVQETDPDWAWWVDERGLAWHEAMAKHDLGDNKSAIVQFERSVEATSPTETRDQYYNRAYLLRVQVNLRSWRAVERTMQQLYPLAIEVASARTVVILQKILHQLRVTERRIPSGVLDEAAKLNLALNTAPV